MTGAFFESVPRARGRKPLRKVIKMSGFASNGLEVGGFDEGAGEMIRSGESRSGVGEVEDVDDSV